jgi:leucyl aminopeptidase (aminopeptidase T)
MRSFNASQGVKILVDTCLRIQPKENVLIVTDTNMIDIAELICIITGERGATITMAVMDPLSAPGMEPPRPIASAMKASDVVMMATTFTLTPSIARAEAQKTGARILSLGGYNYNVLTSDAMQADFIAQKPIVEKVAQLLSDTEKARVTSTSGTDLKIKIGKRKAHASTNICHEPGTLGSPPDIEAYVAPIEDTAEGIIILDGSICLDEFGLIKTPIELSIKKGTVENIRGGDEATAFRNKLESYQDPEMFRIAELGIGLNPLAKLIGDPLIDEGVLGTAHIALGLNFTYGGSIKNAKTHVDCVFRNPTIELDGKVLLKKGKLTNL